MKRLSRFDSSNVRLIPRLVLPGLLAMAMIWGGVLVGPPPTALARRHPDSGVHAPSADACFVDSDGDDVTNFASADGSALQAAVDAAGPGDTLRVAGTCAGVQARGGLTQTLYVSKTLTVRGGYTHTNWTLPPNPVMYTTTLDALGLGRALVINGAITPVVEGLRITGGDASGLSGGMSGRDAGGGVYMRQAAAVISNCVVMSNTAGRLAGGAEGGGLYLLESDGLLVNNTVRDNVASPSDVGYGGGFTLWGGSATLRANRVISNRASLAAAGWGGGGYISVSPAEMVGNGVYGNVASTVDAGYGGGLALRQSAALLQQNTVRANVASPVGQGSGGGLYAMTSDVGLLQNTVIDNVASGAGQGEGGGLFVTGGDVHLEGNRVEGNVGSMATTGQAGGVYLYNQTSARLRANLVLSNTAALSSTAVGIAGGVQILMRNPFTLTNNVLAGNQANTYGGGMVGQAMGGLASPALLQQNTIADNAGGGGQGLVWSGGILVSMTNTIIAGHRGVAIEALNGTSVTLEGTLWHANGIDVSGLGVVVTGTVDLHGDPVFVDPGGGDYHLGAGSEAVDAGVPTGVSSDVDDDARPQGAGYDIGADERRACWVRLNDEPTDYGAVQAALAASTQPTDVVKVAGVCSGVALRGGLWQTGYLSKTLTLRGGYTHTNWSLPPNPVANPTTLDALGLGRVLAVVDGAAPTVIGLRLTGGDATGLGGGALGEDVGGGVFVARATPTISGCWIISNTASSVDEGLGGGLFVYDSGGLLVGSLVSGNVASTVDGGRGGGLHLAGSSMALRENRIVGNTGSVLDEGTGGGLSLMASGSLVEGNVVEANVASQSWTGHGGGMDLMFSNGARLVSNTVRANVASEGYYGHGGGLHLIDSAAALTGNVVLENVASTAYQGEGGGVALSWSPATLVGNRVQGNTASLTGSGWGGGVRLRESQALLKANTVSTNVASAGGDGVGGGLYVEGPGGTFWGNTIVSNTASTDGASLGHGGGLALADSSSFSLTNNLVAGNRASGWGGGVWVRGTLGAPARGQLRHTTLADNGGAGQGIALGPFATLHMTDTIIAGHSGVGITVTAGSTVALEATLWYSNGVDVGGMGVVITGTVDLHGDPAFVNPTRFDYHVGPGSQAVDAGVDAGVASDIDGEPRPRGATYDIGADELFNQAPAADGGGDQTVTTGVTVTLDGRGSDDVDGDLPLAYLWTQTGGPTVTLDAIDAATATFAAPWDPAVLTFTLTVTDSLGWRTGRRTWWW